MELIASNHNGVYLNESLHEYEQLESSVGRVVYHLLLGQLHLPCAELSRDKKEASRLIIKRINEIEELDRVLFGQLEYKQLVAPMQLYLYDLLMQLLGVTWQFRDMGLVRKGKVQLFFLSRDLNMDEVGGEAFGLTELSRFVLKKAKKKNLIEALDRFFILLGGQFGDKLLTALTQYQSETGVVLDKHALSNRILNQERMEALKKHALHLIARK